MLEERSASERSVQSGEIEHRYGPRVHILSNPLLLSLLARLGGPDSEHPEIPRLVRTLYQALLFAAGHELPHHEARVPTRMASLHPKEGAYVGPLLDPDTSLVVVDILRGGILPAQACFETLTSSVPAARVRLDHLTMSRRSDDEGHVTGAALQGDKIGGTVDDSVLILPDPMGATGSTIVRALDHYRQHHGKPRKTLVLPLIMTPEFLRRVLDADPDVIVYALRLDRGLSPPDVLATVPGTEWDRERGLNDQGYIVPGAGGMGEVINNSWC